MDSTKIVDVETPDKRYKLVSSEYGFSGREADILLLMSQGLTVDEIADSLFISKKTVYNILLTCHRKINCKTQFSLALLVNSIIA